MVDRNRQKPASKAAEPPPAKPRKPRQVTVPRPSDYNKRGYLSLAEAAELVTDCYFAISEVAIACWPIQTVIIGQRRHMRKADVTAHAERLINEAEAARLAQPKLTRGPWGRTKPA